MRLRDAFELLAPPGHSGRSKCLMLADLFLGPSRENLPMLRSIPLVVEIEPGDNFYRFTAIIFRQTNPVLTSKRA